MPDDITQVFGDNQRRIRRQRQVIGDENRRFEILTELITEISPQGNVETIESRNASLISGESVWDISQVAGRCQYSDCGVWLTSRTFRYCHTCGLVMCIKCSRWDEKGQIWLCKKCRNRLRLRRFFRGTGRLLLSPFRKRENYG